MRIRSEMKDFDLAYAEEAISQSVRASRGDSDKAKQVSRPGEEKGGKIADPEDKAIFMGI